MKITIVGAGAMGCLYGAKLSNVPNHDVFLIDVWKEHIDAIRKHGLQLEENGETLVFDRLHAEYDAKRVGPSDLVIVFVKSPLTEQAVKSNRAVFGPETVALTLQNGLGNIDVICEEIGASNVIAGTTAHGATMLGPGKMRHAGNGKTIIGELNGFHTQRIERIAKLLIQAGIETEFSENVLGLVWDKLLVNVGINALTGITKLQNGDLLQYPEIQMLLEKAVKEGEMVAKAKGILLNYPDPVQHTKDVCAATAQNKSSMLQDVLNHKQTEIDRMNGAIVREGAALGIATPVNMVLTKLIQFIQTQK